MTKNPHPAKIMAYQLNDGSKAKNMYGEYIGVSHGHELRIDGVRLLYTDIEARNGLIHAIGGLLLPAITARYPSA